MQNYKDSKTSKIISFFLNSIFFTAILLLPNHVLAQPGLECHELLNPIEFEFGIEFAKALNKSINSIQNEAAINFVTKTKLDSKTILQIQQTLVQNIDELPPRERDVFYHKWIKSHHFENALFLYEVFDFKFSQNQTKIEFKAHLPNEFLELAKKYILSNHNIYEVKFAFYSYFYSQEVARNVPSITKRNLDSAINFILSKTPENLLASDFGSTVLLFLIFGVEYPVYATKYGHAANSASARLLKLMSSEEIHSKLGVHFRNHPNLELDKSLLKVLSVQNPPKEDTLLLIGTEMTLLKRSKLKVPLKYSLQAINDDPNQYFLPRVFNGIAEVYKSEKLTKLDFELQPDLKELCKKIAEILRHNIKFYNLMMATLDEQFFTPEMKEDFFNTLKEIP